MLMDVTFTWVNVDQVFYVSSFPRFLFLYVMCFVPLLDLSKDHFNFVNKSKRCGMHKHVGHILLLNIHILWLGWVSFFSQIQF